MLSILSLLLAITVLPGLTIGLIRKTKARFQNRVGAPIWQPIFDLIKLFRKGETLSDTASSLFRFAAAFNVAAMLYVALIVPWFQPKPIIGNADVFAVLYLFAAARLFSMLAALDTGSSFGGFAASREATLSVLVEPVPVLALAALAVVHHTTDLNAIFVGGGVTATESPALWLLCGATIFLFSLVDLSRMPVDDPTTHLELTMVHEAMIIEASGKNLALFELAHALKLTVLFGLVAQCFLRAVPAPALSEPLAYACASFIGLAIVAIAVGVLESLAVKLAWRRTPEFIAYSLTVALVATFIAVGGQS